jgi:hypothetical protein
MKKNMIIIIVIIAVVAILFLLSRVFHIPPEKETAKGTMLESEGAFMLGKWYLDLSLSENISPLDAAKPQEKLSDKAAFKTKNPKKLQKDSDFIETVVWYFSEDKLICKYKKDAILNKDPLTDSFGYVTTAKVESWNEKYYWTYDQRSNTLKIFRNNKKKPATFAILNKDPLTIKRIQ